MDALLERLPAVYYLLAALVMLLPRKASRALGGAGVALVGMAAAADAAGSAEADAAFVTINELLALAGAVLVAGAVWSALRRAPARAESCEALRPPSSWSGADPVGVCGLALAGLGPHLLLIGLGAALALTSAARKSVRSGRLRALLPLVVGAVSLGVSLTLMLTVLGPLGGLVRNLPEGPFSPATERLLALLLGGSVLLFAGLPPLHRLPWGQNLAPLGAILLARLILPALPLGLLIWQVPAMVLLTAAFLWCALIGSGTQAAVAAGLLSLWSGAPGGRWAGVVLVAWGWLVEVGVASGVRRRIVLTSRWDGLFAIPVALAALPALRAGLTAQVGLSVLVVMATVTGFLTRWYRTAHPFRAPLY